MEREEEVGRGGRGRSEAAASLPSFTRFSSHDAETLDRSF